MLKQLLKELDRNQKMEFIRAGESIYWTMTSYDVLRSKTDEELDSFFEFIFKNVPSELMDRTIEIAKKVQ